MNRKDNEVLVFDLDDTLYKERAFVVSGRRAVAREASVRSGVDADELFSLMERSENAFGSLLERLSSTPASDMTIDRVLEIYRYHKPQLTLPSEVVLLIPPPKIQSLIVSNTSPFVPF